MSRISTGQSEAFVFMARATAFERCSSLEMSANYWRGISRPVAIRPLAPSLSPIGKRALLGTLISRLMAMRAARSYTEVDLKRFSGHQSLRSLERYIADNREAAKRKAREWERRQHSQ